MNQKTSRPIQFRDKFLCRTRIALSASPPKCGIICKTRVTRFFWLSRSIITLIYRLISGGIEVKKQNYVK